MTTPFLSRRDRDALRRQYRRGERPLRVVQAELDGRVGLLAATDRRVLWVSRGALRTRVEAVARDQVQSVTRRTEHFGSVVLKTRAGRRFEWWLLEPGACDAVLESLQAPRPASTRPTKGKEEPVRFQAATPPTRPAPRARMPAPAPATPADSASREWPASRPTARDGSSYLPTDTAERRARLQRQLDRGIITRREYEWQVESLR